MYSAMGNVLHSDIWCAWHQTGLRHMCSSEPTSSLLRVTCLATIINAHMFVRTWPGMHRECCGSSSRSSISSDLGLLMTLHKMVRLDWRERSMAEESSDRLPSLSLEPLLAQISRVHTRLTRCACGTGLVTIYEGQLTWQDQVLGSNSRRDQKMTAVKAWLAADLCAHPDAVMDRGVWPIRRLESQPR